MTNMLYFGDNLEILGRQDYVADGSVDLIYLDPPFNSQAQYNLLFERPGHASRSAQAGAFRDTWHWEHETTVAYEEIMRLGGAPARVIGALVTAFERDDLMAYLVMMTIRLIALRQKLKPTGSLYLHCDPTASHYLKAVLDAIFGRQHFISEIVWKRSHAHNSARRWGPIHDVILFYAKNDTYTWNQVYQPYDQAYVDRFFKFDDDDGRGRYWTGDLTGAGTRNGPSGEPWRGYDVRAMGRHWAYAPEELDRLDGDNRIFWPPTAGAMPKLKRYLREAKGVPAQDVLLDVPSLQRMSAAYSEALGYPTQKPLALILRIIAASSNPGDLILDPFCGCGTTIEAAERSGRRWIGIDIAVHAIKVVEARLADAQRRVEIGPLDYRVEGMPRDFESAVKLAEKDKYQFQWWANYLFNPHALREQRRGMDRGIDGELFFPNGPGRPWGRLLTSVKGGERVGPGMVRDFRGVLDRERAEMGLFICLRKPSPEMRREAATARTANTIHGDLPKLQIVAIEEFFEGKMPVLPPLQHLPAAALGRAVRRQAIAVAPLDATQPELLLPFGDEATERATVERHLNPQMVTERPARRSA